MEEALSSTKIAQTRAEKPKQDRGMIIREKQKGCLKWTDEENTIYIDFLKENRSCIKNQKHRRSQKVFQKMSKVLPSRTARQCRTHHLKMVQTHKTLHKIIRYLESKLQRYSGHYGVEQGQLSGEKKEIQDNVQGQAFMADEQSIWEILDSRAWVTEYVSEVGSKGQPSF